MNTKYLIKSIFLTLVFGLNLSTYVAASEVIINGQLLNRTQITMLEQSIGTRIAPGNYISNGNCWVNLHNGISGCLSNGSGDRFSRYGSGSRSANGDWNHWSDAAGGGVGGTSDGCIYTTYGWSNC